MLGTESCLAIWGRFDCL